MVDSAPSTLSILSWCHSCLPVTVSSPKALIERALSENDIVLFDRYVASNIAHQSAKLDEPERSTLMTWIDELGA